MPSTASNVPLRCRFWSRDAPPIQSDATVRRRNLQQKLQQEAPAGQSVRPGIDKKGTKNYLKPPTNDLKEGFRAAWLCSGGAVRRHHGPRLRWKPLWRILRHVPPLPDQRRFQQHPRVRFRRWGTHTGSRANDLFSLVIWGAAVELFITPSSSADGA